ncbi:AMP-binding protein [Bacteroidetes bacterium UKL13-3]|nr:AMP-binding protein [Bacteroidetes bacterium UKL13-3]HCP92690.1 long-chain fatty acid--CoA ligase [Bacteroidota bacterium]
MEQNFKSLHYFLRNAAYNIKTPQSTFLLEKVNNEYKPITYAEIIDQVNAISAFLYNKGYQKGDKAALIIENCPEYIAFDQGLMQLGVINVSIYPTLSESEVEYILNDSQATIILVGTPFLLKKINKIKANCPHLKYIITTFEDKKTDTGITFNEMIAEGKSLYPGLKDDIEQRLESVTSDDLSCLLYTSGTTSKPKGALLSHGNFMSNVIMGIELLPIVDKTYRFLSFLPLCHVYERTATYYLSTYVGSEIAFAQSLEALSNNIIEVKPNAILTVPRLLERIEERVRKTTATAGGIKLKIFNWALKVGEQRRHNKENNTSNSLWLNLQLPIAEKLVFSKIKERLGGRMGIMVSGGGALPQHVGEFFGNIGVLVCEGYGLTETSPLVTVNEFHRQIFGSVGRVGKGCSVAIQNPETKEVYTVQTFDSFKPDFESLEGEILVKGPNVMKGYYNQPEQTAEAIDKEGWLHTGDVGKFHKGYLKITDRIKNIIVNSFGKNVYPTPIENAYLKSNKIEQIFLIGDKQEYLTAIIVPSKEEMKDVFKYNENYFAEADEFITDTTVKEWLEVDMKEYEKELGKFERVKEFIVKRRPFSLEDGEMTPTQKVKRKIVEQKYADAIKKMYVNIVD